MREPEEAAAVLGIPIGDPEVLKSTQVILVCVGINAFFLVLQLLQAADTQRHHGAAHVSAWIVAQWVFEIFREAAMVVTGYLGVKRSSRPLLGTFYVISVISCILSVISIIMDLWSLKLHEIPILILQVLDLVFFVVMSRTALFLFKKAGEGPLDGASRSRRVGIDSSYSLLGIPMMDLQVLKATQIVFTSMGIIVSSFGGMLIVISDAALFPHAPGASTGRVVWFLCLGILVTMGYSGYYGVKESSVRLLSCFRCISCCFAALFIMFTMMVLFFCGVELQCFSPAIMFGTIAAVFLAAFRSAGVLREKASSGMILTAPHHEDDGVQANTVGSTQVQMGPVGHGACDDEPSDVI